MLPEQEETPEPEAHEDETSGETDTFSVDDIIRDLTCTEEEAEEDYLEALRAAEAAATDGRKPATVKKLTAENRAESVMHYKEDGLTVSEADLPRLYEAMLDYAARGKRADCSASAFRAVAATAGTHSTRMISPRAGKSPLMSDDARIEDVMAFCNAGSAKVAKILFRRITVKGQDGSGSIIEDLMSLRRGGNGGPHLTAAMVALGEERIEAVKDGLLTERTIKDLTYGDANASWTLPIIFLPGDDGEDIQVTPISPAMAYNRMRAGRARSNDAALAAHKAAKKKGRSGEQEDRSREPRPVWRKFSECALSGSPQNITTMIGGGRVRLSADFPDMMTGESASVWRVSRGGKFPNVPADDSEDLILKLDGLIASLDPAGLSPPIVEAIRRLSVWLSRIAYEHAADVADAAAALGFEERPAVPNLTSLLIYGVRDESRKAMIRVAAHDGFKRSMVQFQQRIDALVGVTSKDDGERGEDDADNT